MTSLQEVISSIVPIRVVTAKTLEQFKTNAETVQEVTNMYDSIKEAISSISETSWITASDITIGQSSVFKRMQEQALAGWASDPIIRRAVDIYEENFYAGGVDISVANNAGWVASTLGRMFPRGLFRFMCEYLMYWAVFGEMFIRIKKDQFNRPFGYELISPLEVDDVVEVGNTGEILFHRRWQTWDAKISSDGEYILKNTVQRDKAYSSRDDCIIIRWNSTADRGQPFIYPAIPWTLVYNEWLKDRSIANRIRAFAYLVKNVDKHAGSTKVIADEFQSNLMTGQSYKAMSHTQYGHGLKKEKMPSGGILHADKDTKWEALQFSIQGNEAAPDAHFFRQEICGLTSIPEELLYMGMGKLDTASAKVEMFVRKVEFLRDMFTEDLNAIIEQIRHMELGDVRNLGRPIDTNIALSFKPAAVGERRFITEDINKAMAGGQISRKTAQLISPFVKDQEDEERQIRKEAKDKINQSFLDRIAAAKSDRDDEDADKKKKEKDEKAGVRSQERDQKNQTGKEE